MEKQDKIDKTFKNILKMKYDHTNPAQELFVKKYFHKMILDFFKIPPQWAGYQTDYENIDFKAFEKYAQIIKKINLIVQSWGGSVYIVFIPDAFFFSNSNVDNKQIFIAQLREVAHAYDIKFINLVDAFEGENPFNYYAPISNYYGHFNSRGARKAHEYLYRSI